MEQRKITYRMYPNVAEFEGLLQYLGLQQRLYNTALEERIRHDKETGKSLGYKAQAKCFTHWRSYSALGSVNAQSQQNTLKRLDRAYQAFFRRVKLGETPGFPRFKPLQRYKGWGYNTYGDGLKLFQNQTTRSKTGKPEFKNGKVRLSGIGEIELRGRGRFIGSPKTTEVIRKQDKWYLSVTYNVEAASIARQRGSETAAFDWGLTTLLTIANADGSMETLDNPRWLKNNLAAIKVLQQGVSVEEIKAKATLGLKSDEPLAKGQRLPISTTMKRLYKPIGALHSKASRQRHDFYPKLTALLVSRFACLGTEELGVKSMTKKLKPSQRCHRCGTLVKKELSERTHQCSCGCTCGRDENAAKTILRWMFEGDYWVGTTQTGSGLFSVLPETPPYSAEGV